ncbi:hypothetical protein [Streptomyces sp. LBL]|uniref:hypothetical protein n=1 Tax=Streptomyces sp. LBL TaxID=2940562 RepID=UPI0024754F88|nr:hypothetical protein [Streptomyces sp. LBL]
MEAPYPVSAEPSVADESTFEGMVAGADGPSVALESRVGGGVLVVAGALGPEGTVTELPVTVGAPDGPTVPSVVAVASAVPVGGAAVEDRDASGA